MPQRTRLLRGAALAAGAAAAAAQMGTAWSCPTQPGPFQLWINEVHYNNEGVVDEQIEIASLQAANVNMSAVDSAWGAAAGWTERAGSAAPWRRPSATVVST
jgi:hypothetical protein